MRKDTERIKKWRERKKAEGKKSYTVVLSTEAQKVLVSEKDKTGSSYSVIIEKALKSPYTNRQQQGICLQRSSKKKLQETLQVTTNILIKYL
jgi:predicted transcriptional regulator